MSDQKTEKKYLISDSFDLDVVLDRTSKNADLIKEIGKIGKLFSIDCNIIRLFFREYSVTSLSSMFRGFSNGSH